MSEVDDDAKLNEKMIKAISGGDKLNLRSICKTDTTIIPTATLWGAFNVEPIFKVEKAMINRIVNFPFHANFETDVNFENKLLSMKDYIFSFIMTNGIINHKVEPSEEMMIKKRNYIADNITDYLKDYIHINIKHVAESTNKRSNWCIKRDDFRRSYNDWCISMKYKLDTSNSASFTKKITALGIKNYESNSILWYINIQFGKEDEDL